MGSILGTLGVGIGFGATIAGIKGIVDSAAKLDDVAEKTGAAVAELSKYEQVARIGGHATEVYETALIRMSKALHAQDDEAKGAGKALAALGLSQDALRGKDTAEALRIVAVELNKYADGGGKSALAMDLLGKSGAQALPFLKDLANEQGISARVTAEQAAAAEEAQKQLGRLKNEMHGVAQSIALNGVPGFTDWIAANRKAIEIAGSFSSAMRLFVFNLEAMTTEKPREQIARLNTELERLQKTMAGSLLQRSGLDQLFGGQKLQDLPKQIEFLKYLERQEALARGVSLGGDTRGEMQRFGLAGAVQPQLDYKAAEAANRAVADLAKLYEEVQRLGASIDVAVPRILDKEFLNGVKKSLEEGKKGWIAYADAVFAEADAANAAAASSESFTQWAERLKESTLNLIDPTRALVQAHRDLDLLAATGWITQEQANMAKLSQELLGLLAPTKNLHDEIQRAWEQGVISTDQMRTALEKIQPALDRTDDLAKRMGESFADAFEDLVFSSRKGVDALKSFEAAALSIARMFYKQLVTKPLENAIGNVNVGAFLKAIIGGGGIDTGGIVIDPVDTGPGFYDFVGSFATGTSRVPRTGLALVHEGEQIIPANEVGSGVTYAPTFNVDSRTDRADIVALMRREDARTVDKIADLTRRGGAYSKAVRGR